MGTVFLGAGAIKLFEGAAVLPGLAVLSFLPPGSGSVLSSLPIIEIVTGLLLLSGLLPALAALAALSLSAAFTAVNVYGLAAGAPESCGCLGAAVTLGRGQMLGLDLAMLAMALPLVMKSLRTRTEGARPWPSGAALGILALMLAYPLPAAAAPGAGTPGQGQLAPLNPAFLAWKTAQPQAMALEGGRRVTGLIPTPMDLGHLARLPAAADGTASAAALAEGPLPAAWDWRTLGRVSPVKDQGNCGTCWVFGNDAALESRVLQVEGQLYDFSEQNLVVCQDPSYYYLVGDRCAGGELFMAPDTLTKKGARLESCQPYNVPVIDQAACSDCPTVVRATDWRLVANAPGMTAQIKDAVYRYGPVTATYAHSDSHLAAGYVYYWPGSTAAPNHLVTIVGWDDSITHPAGGGHGAWIVKNSWGASWGDNGYFYLAYDSGNLQGIGSFHGSAGYVPGNSAEKVYYWDEAGFVGQFGYGSESAWMGSVFTASEPGFLTRVEFWTTSNNAGYELYVYDGGLSGPLLASGTGSTQEQGYYSIVLDSPVSLAAGQSFAITVKMTTPGYFYPLPTEFSVNGFVNPPIQTNSCFIRSSSSAPWTDAAASSINVSLRARVVSGTAPVAPGRLAASPASPTSLSLTWIDRSANETGFKIERKTGLHGSYAQVGTAGANTPGYSDSGLTAGATYYYRVRAFNEAGASEYSQEVAATPSGGRMAFVSDRNGVWELYTMTAGGGGQARVAFNGYTIAEPAWSPDGSKIAVSASTSGNWDIFVINADGSNPARLTTSAAQDRHPSWSPDGSRIVFWSNRDGNQEIYLVPASGGAQTRLTNNMAEDSSPVWSPDGSRIAFQSRRDGNYQVYVMADNGANQTRLTTGNANDTAPAWSPDGRLIAFLSDRLGHTHDVFSMNPYGGGVRGLTNSAERKGRLAWSPDGGKIAFGMLPPGAIMEQVYTINADGSGLTRLTNDAYMDNHPAWAPLTALKTEEATNVTSGGARLNASVLSLGGPVSSLSFLWGTAPGVYTGETAPAALNGQTGTYGADLTGLAGGAIYYRARLTGEASASGAEGSFTPGRSPPAVSTIAATSLAATGATLNGNLSNLGTAPAVNVSFEWGLSARYGNVTPSQSRTAAGSFSAMTGGLAPGCTYHYRAVASGGAHGGAAGQDSTFRTLMPALISETAAAAVRDGDGVAVIAAGIVRVKNSTGVTAEIPGGIGAFKAKATTSPAGGIELVSVRESAPYAGPSLDAASGTFAVLGVSQPAQPSGTVAKLVARLTGDCQTPYSLNIAFDRISAASGVVGAPEEHSSTLTFRRGDVDGNGVVNIFDAMFIAQNVVGKRTADTISYLSAASVMHDGPTGDSVTITDAMYIAQYLVGKRTATFELVP